MAQLFGDYVLQFASHHVSHLHFFSLPLTLSIGIFFRSRQLILSSFIILLSHLEWRWRPCVYFSKLCKRSRLLCLHTVIVAYILCRFLWRSIIFFYLKTLSSHSMSKIQVQELLSLTVSLSQLCPKLPDSRHGRSVTLLSFFSETTFSEASICFEHTTWDSLRFISRDRTDQM